MNERAGHPERIIPEATSRGIVAIHLKRYDFVRSIVTGKQVLDVACGVGYGAYHLADVAQRVVGVDIDPQALWYAQQRYHDRSNMAYVQADAGRLPFPAGSFDVVCSFETIEHVPDVHTYLSEIRRVLVPGGIYYVSTPAAPRSTTSPTNPHHVQEWHPADFARLLHTYFPMVNLYSQLRRTTTTASWLKRLDVFKLRTRLPTAFTRQVAHSAGVEVMGEIDLQDVMIVQNVKANASEIIAQCISGHSQ